MAVKLGSLIIDVKADTQNLVKGMNSAQAAVKRSINVMKSAVAGLAIGAAFKSAIQAGYEYNKTMEEQKTSITALIAATSKHEDALGNTISNTELYTRANAEAVQVLKQLEVINKATPHTLSQTAQIYKTMLPSMKSLGVSTEDLIHITKQLSIAAGAGGVQFNSLLAGVDGLATGTVLANSDLGRFLSTIGLSNEELKNTGNIVGLLEDKLGSFKAPDTMAVALSNLSNAWGKFMGTLTSDSFSGAKEAINALADGINKYSGYLEGASITTRAYASKIADTFKFLVEVVKASFIGLSDGVSSSFYSMLSNIQGQIASFVYSLKDLPKVGDAMKKLAIDINTTANLTKEKSLESSKAIQDHKVILEAASKEMNKSIYERIIAYDAELQASKKAAEQQATIAKEMGLSAEQAKKLKEEQEKIAKANEQMRTKFDSLRDSFDSNGAAIRKLVGDMEFLNIALTKGIITQKEFDEVAKNMGDSYVKSIQDSGKATKTLGEQLTEIKDKISGQLESSMTNTFRSWMDGAQDFGNLMGNVLKDIAAELFRVMVVQEAVRGIQGMFGFSNGGVINNGVTAFASGGIVGSPTTFPMRNGTGLMGEAGPEAIMPVSRIGGDLGVKVSQAPISVQVINNSNNTVDVQQDGDNLRIMIDKIENQIASNMARGTSSIGGALNIMRSQGRL